MVHLLPHWTHPGKEGINIPVVAYTNCKKVELFFNDKSLGEKTMGEDLQLVWQVPYQPGKLTAVAKDENGTVLAKTSQQTAGIPSGINIVSNKTTVKANRRDVINMEITVVDKQGIPVPDDDHLVYFDIEGPGKLIGVDNGDVADLNPTKNTNQRKVFKGKCVGLVQTTDQKGNIKITVRSEGLKSSIVQIPSV
jgi:beta-galactosidase